MRNALKFLILVMLTSGLTSCSLFNVDIKTNIEGPLSLVSNEAELKSTEDHGINGSAIIDIMDNEDLAEYEDLIEDIKVKSVSLSVVSVDSSDVVIRAGSEFSISTPTNSGITWPINPDWPVEVGTTINLTADNYNVLNAMLEGDEPVTLSSTGTCNKGNVHISLTYDIEVVVEANPL
jgi:hypothetical protein